MEANTASPRSRDQQQQQDPANTIPALIADRHQHAALQQHLPPRAALATQQPHNHHDDDNNNNKNNDSSPNASANANDLDEKMGLEAKLGVVVKNFPV